ncbi:hypothetical protein DFP72DRAFT_879911 [Ephemerocybe angulata]|uniref:Uncharacterized protein n=1 Tax=Ephemerocybe angulata TaxID=980116 RepID=A0A8H6M9N1_9AGAR|nr:hypothetical protein DFP72DRAFT_879911 [Tulosesus angulatus]
MESVFDEALEHRILPKSLERPVLTKRLYGEYWRGVMALFERFETKVIEVIEAGDKMTVHASSNGTSLSGTPYRNEYVLMIHFTPPVEAGGLPRMRYLKEFVDSGFSMRFFKEERERQRVAREGVVGAFS